MAGGVADIVEIVVLAAGADAFLRRWSRAVGALFRAGEDVLELHHARIGEQQRRIVARHKRARTPRPYGRGRGRSRGRSSGVREAFHGNLVAAALNSVIPGVRTWRASALAERRIRESGKGQRRKNEGAPRGAAPLRSDRSFPHAKKGTNACSSRSYSSASPSSLRLCPCCRSPGPGRSARHWRGSPLRSWRRCPCSGPERPWRFRGPGRCAAPS